jgi:hypothetical protein
VARSTDPETYLRLACERILLSQGRNNGMPDGIGPAVISRALAAAGTLHDERAKSILDEYELAMALRSQQGGRMLMHRRSMVRGERQRLSVERVAVCACEFERGGEQWNLERVLFTAEATHLDLTGTGPVAQGAHPGRRGLVRHNMAMRPPQPPHPQTLALADDQGTGATARVGQSRWGGGSWEASYISDAPLSPDTEWIQVDGTRIELPQRQPAPEVHIEEIEPMDPLRAMLYGEILSTDRRHGGYDTFEIACQALVAIGALDEDDPVLVEVRRIAGAVAGAAPVPGLPEPWASLLARFSKGDGRIGSLAIGAVIEDLDGFSIRLDTLTSEQTSFSISLAMSPGTPLLRHFPGLNSEPSPITWWAEDDRMNAYVAFSDRGGGGNIAEGQVTSLAALDPKATLLRLLPTGSRRRGVVTIPLAPLGGAG